MPSTKAIRLTADSVPAKGWGPSTAGPHSSGNHPSDPNRGRLVDRRPTISGERIVAHLVPPRQFVEATIDSYRPDDNYPSQSEAVEAVRAFGKRFGDAPSGGLFRRRKTSDLPPGLYLDGDFTHDDLDHRWLGSDLTVGTVGRIGYRIAPWRALTITPSVGLELQRDYDLSGRLESVARGGATFGLDVGWLFF